MSNNLFPDLTEANVEELARFKKLLTKAWPLKGKHREQLKYGIKDMSRGLTTERSERKAEYMGDARLLSPYLYYFLPWNLYRMSRLFTGLELDIPDGSEVADLGSGPLTAILALWISRPHLRERKLNFTCLDRSTKALQSGLKIFTELAGKDSPWHIRTVKGNFTDRLHRKADLILVANAFNELDWSGRTARPQAEKLARHLTSSTTETGRILLVETGVRLAGRIIAEMRTQFLALDYKPIAPCPHVEDCPMPALAPNSPWCHFNFSVKGVPEWLQQLSGEAQLTKDNASLNFLYLSPKGGADWGAVRIISEPFRLHGNQGQYACSHKGLTLVEYAKGVRPLNPGQTLVPDWPEKPRTDLKSGALILPVKPEKPSK